MRRRLIRPVRAMALVHVLLLAAALTATPGQAQLPGPVSTFASTVQPIDVIVQLWDGADPLPAQTLTSLGGVVTRDLPVVAGFAATVPADLAETIEALPGVRAVTPDGVVMPLDAGGDPSGPPSVFGDVVGSSASHAAGHTGAGTTVALIDTGITEVPDLAGRIVTVTDPVTGQPADCVNFSDEAGCADTYGHGTFIAGLIAGDGTSSGGLHTGVAPDAELVALKLSGRDGQSQVSDVLAAIGWVIDNRDTHGIDVLNLSLRTDSRLTYRLDPMNHAVERAWAAGIVVVVSAGNLGGADGTIAKPADDPWVISVGSTDDQGTVTQSDDVVSSFSSRGPTQDGLIKPDLVVPGRSLVSLRSPGSEADIHFPAFVDDTYRRGSGTSFSAGLVSGAAAVLLGADPALSNDAVKHALVTSAAELAGADPTAAGAGVMNVLAALTAQAGEANQEFFHPIFAPGAPGTATDFQGSNWQGSNWQGSNWQGSNWQGSNWQGSNWQGSNWQGSNWQGSNWQGSNWQGSNWQGSNWQGSNWQGSNWQSEYWE